MKEIEELRNEIEMLRAELSLLSIEHELLRSREMSVARALDARDEELSSLFGMIRKFSRRVGHGSGCDLNLPPVYDELHCTCGLEELRLISQAISR